MCIRDRPNNIKKNNVPPLVIHSLYDRSDSKYPISPTTHHVIRTVANTANIILVDFIVIKDLRLKSLLMFYIKNDKRYRITFLSSNKELSL